MYRIILYGAAFAFIMWSIISMSVNSLKTTYGLIVLFVLWDILRDNVRKYYKK